MTSTREHMEKVLSHLVLALRRLAENGVERFVIAADHGYVFGEDLAESDKIDPPGEKGGHCTGESGLALVVEPATAISI